LPAPPPFFGWVSLAGEKRFINVEVAGFDQPGIGGHEIAGREKNDIARYDLPHWDIDWLSVAKRLSRKCNLLAQLLSGVLGLALLRHVEDHGHDHNDGDDDEARDVSGECRYGRREEQKQDQRMGSGYCRHTSRSWTGAFRRVRLRI
jgi:hypothetical protein